MRNNKKLDRRVVIVTRATRLENILAKENTISQAKFRMKSMNSLVKSKTAEANTEFDLYENEHNKYQVSIRDVRDKIAAFAPIQMLDRKYLSNFVFGDTDIIVCIGQDGLVANTMKYLNGQPVIGVNPDKGAYDGVLLPFEPKDAPLIAREVASDRRKFREVSMGEARLPDGQSLIAVNDFFIGQRSHVSARYIIKYNGLKEPQSSSGVIISTGLGSTGWMKSVIAGSRGISSAVIGSPYGGAQQNETLIEEDFEKADEVLAQDCMPAEIDACADMREMETELSERNFRRQLVEKTQAPVLKRKKEFGMSELSKIVGKWESRDLLFAVREPFPSKTSGTSIVFGTIAQGNTLRVESLMGENGVIFSDGIESDYLEFNSGMEATISIAAKSGKIII